MKLGTYCTSTGHTWKTPRGFCQIQWLTYTKPGEEKEKLNRRCRLAGGPDWSANFDRAKRTIISFCMFVERAELRAGGEPESLTLWLPFHNIGGPLEMLREKSLSHRKSPRVKLFPALRASKRRHFKLLRSV